MFFFQVYRPRKSSEKSVCGSDFGRKCKLDLEKSNIKNDRLKKSGQTKRFLYSGVEKVSPV